MVNIEFKLQISEKIRIERINVFIRSEGFLVLVPVHNNIIHTVFLVDPLNIRAVRR